MSVRVLLELSLLTVFARPAHLLAQLVPPLLLAPAAQPRPSLHLIPVSVLVLMAITVTPTAEIAKRALLNALPVPEDLCPTAQLALQEISFKAQLAWLDVLEENI